MKNFLQNHKFAILLTIFILYILVTSTQKLVGSYRYQSISPMVGTTLEYSDSSNSYQKGLLSPTISNPINQPGTRKTVTETSISIQVDDVTKAISGIQSKVIDYGGFVVSSNISRPNVGETGTFIFRVPSGKVNDLVKYLRENSIKVVSENVMGYDVTDQYTDIEEQIRIYTQTKETYVSLLEDTRNLKDINAIQNITQNIINTQNYIDNLKGRLDMLNKTTQTSLVTVYLSTDETSLPINEPLSWRPDVVFKHASRSLVKTMQSVGTLAIWVSVYSVITVPAFIGYKIVKKKVQNRTK